MAETFPKWEDTLPVNEVPRFEDTAPVEAALPAFDQTSEVTVKDEIRAAIPEIVQQIRQAIIPAPKLAEFTPQQLQQTDPNLTVDVRSMQPPPAQVGGIPLAGNLQPGSVETLQKMEEPEAAAQLRAGQAAVGAVARGAAKTGIFAASLANAAALTAIPGQWDKAKAQWQRVAELGEQAPLEEISNALGTAMLVYGGYEGLKAVPALYNLARNSNVVRKLSIPERGLATIPDDEMFAIYKSAPDEVKKEMATYNPQVRSILLDPAKVRRYSTQEAPASRSAAPAFEATAAAPAVRQAQAVARPVSGPVAMPRPAAAPQEAPTQVPLFEDTTPAGPAQEDLFAPEPPPAPKPITGSPEREAMLASQMETAKAGLEARPESPVEGWTTEALPGGETLYSLPSGYRVTVPAGADPKRFLAGIREIEKAEGEGSQIGESASSTKLPEGFKASTVPLTDMSGKVVQYEQRIESPNGSIVSRGIDTKGREYYEIEGNLSQFNSMVKTGPNGELLLDKAKAREVFLQIPEVPNAEKTGAEIAAPSQEAGTVGEPGPGLRLRDNAEVGGEVQTGEVKQPWEMTQKEYLASLEKESGKPISGLQDHPAFVAEAVDKGLPVPAEVLKDYPELMPQAMSQAGEADVFPRESIRVGKPQVSRRKDPAGIMHGRSVTNIEAPFDVTIGDKRALIENTEMLQAHVSGNVDSSGKVPLKKDKVWTAYAGRPGRDNKIIRSGVTYKEAVEIAKDYVYYANPSQQSAFEARKVKALADKESQIKANEAKIAKVEAEPSGPTREKQISMPKVQSSEGLPSVEDAIRQFDFPEDSQVSKDMRLYRVVDLFRNMEGGIPQVVKRFRKPGVLGTASNAGKIKLNRLLGMNENLASMALAHELAHVADALYGDTTKTYARGNILGRIGAMNRYLYDNLTSTMKPREEVVSAIKDVKAGVLEQAKREATAQNLKGPARADFIKAKIKELSAPQMEAAGLISKETITKELTDLARWWNKDPNFKAKGVELYAEAMSVYLLTPKDVAQRAPIFSNAIKNWIQKKPEFEQAVNEFWTELAKGPEEGAGRVYNRATDNFQKYRDAKATAENKALEAKTSLGLLELASMAVDYTIPLTNRMSQLGLQPWDSPFHEIQAWTHSAAPREAYLRKINDNIRKAVIDSKNLSEDMVAMQLLLNRVARGDRSEMLNTLGITPQSAPEIEAVIKQRAGEEYDKLQQIVEAVYDAHSEILAEGKGVLNEAGLQKMLDNRFYATFSLTKFIEEQRGAGGGIGKLIHPQLGSIDDIGSPLEALVEKDVRLQYAFLRSKAFQKFYEWGTKLGDGTVIEAERTAGGDFKGAPAGYETVYWLWDSKVQAMYVKDGFWQVFKKQPTEASRYAAVAESALKFFKYLFVNLNPGFFLTNPIRDSFFTSANLKELPFFSLDQKYKFGALESLARTMKELPEALRHQLGNETSKAIQDLKALGVTQSEYNRDLAQVTKGLERMLSANGIFTQGRKIDGPGQAMLRAMEIALDVGRASDMASKMAAMKLLKEKHPDANPAWLAHLLRTRAGTPDTTNKGALTPAYNWIFMYSQVALMGWRGNIAAAKENPGSFAVKMMGQAILPRLLLMAAGAGLIGHDEESRRKVKRVVAGVPEWFKASSLVVPLGLTKTGKSVFISLPQDELSRSVGGAVYYMVKNMTEENRNSLLSDTLNSLKAAMDFSFSQAPGLNPIIQTVIQGKDLMDLPEGEGPKDSFGRPMIPSRRINEYPARKGPALASYAKNWWNFAGLGTFTGKLSDKPEETTTLLEDFFKIPLGGAMLNRFVRVSDSGLPSKAFEAKEQVQAERAVSANDRVDRMVELRNEFFKENDREPGPREVYGFYQQVKQEMPEAMQGVSVADFRRSYAAYTVGAKGTEGRVQAVFKAGSNEAKAAALEQLSKEMSPADLGRVIKQARRDKMLSPRAVQLYRRAQRKAD